MARLLVIDDDPAGSVLRDLLSGLGYEVGEASGGADGLALFRRDAYDLVVTDLAMPGMSGWEVAEAVQSASPGAPVILVTGSATDLDAQRADALGVAILHKPVPLAELRTAVRRALGRLGPRNAADRPARANQDLGSPPGEPRS